MWPWIVMSFTEYTGLFHTVHYIYNIFYHHWTSAVDSTWGNWADWGDCSVTCGSGSKERTRSCLAPQNGGQETECSTSDAPEQDTEPCQTNVSCPGES